MVGRIALLCLWLAALAGCECGPKSNAEVEDLSAAKIPANFDQVMADHARLSIAARNALIRGDLPVARQSMRKLAFFMEHVPFPEQGREYARISKELAEQVRESSDLEEASMAFARLSYACGQCHHALDRGPPIELEPPPDGEDLTMHMRRHHWAVERMWEALLSDSPETFQRAARTLAEAPLLGSKKPDAETPPGTTRLAYEVHDLAFAAAVEGSTAEDDYVPAPGEPREAKPTSRGQAEIFGQLLSACSQCHRLVDARPALTDERPREPSR
jgi:mono/diheme cytochrome c family protein